jgi:hypothetical protein
MFVTMPFEVINKINMRLIATILILTSFVSCGESKKEVKEKPLTTVEKIQEKQAEIQSVVISKKKKTHASMAQKDMEKAKQIIEKKYGEQWDFCTCVQKNDSINKAFTKANIPEKEFDRLFKRLEYVEDKCQVFLIEDANSTPEQREAHAKKVKDCLRR